MLVVARTPQPFKPGVSGPGLNTLHMDGPCMVTILEVNDDGTVQVGIEAERHVNIVRGEIVGKPRKWKHVGREQAAAAAREPDTFQPPINLTPSVDCGACDRGKE